MTIRAIETPNAPKAIGPYSQAIKAAGLVFVSGQVGVLPESGRLIEGGIDEQTIQALRNIEVVLKAAGSRLNNVVKTTVYMTDLSNFAAMNEVYAQYFANNKPARATIEVSRLPGSALIEIEAVALAGQ